MRCIVQTQGITYTHLPTPNPNEIYQGPFCGLFISFMIVYFENYLFIILNLNLIPFLNLYSKY
jgi:hypothetical protein